MHDKKEPLCEYIVLLFSILSGDFDSDVYKILPKSCNGVTFATFLESYYYALKRNNPNFDPKFNLVYLIMPPMMNYGYKLASYGLWNNAQDYVNHIMGMRDHMGILEDSQKFVS